MELSEYQNAASETSQLKSGGPQGAIVPMLGLASEAGSILNVYKKYLRDGIDLASTRQFLSEELGDLIWYVAELATAFDLNLEQIADANLSRTRDLCGLAQSPHEFESLPILDANYPEHERFPRRLVVECAERQPPSGHLIASLTLVLAEPNWPAPD